jgi:regulator of protease activity HflC (stomatin/prohibitin superfamily)
MSIAASVEARIQSVSVSEDTIAAQLVDGRTISVPLVWSWRLSEATPDQRARFEIIGSGTGIRWPEIDEDISVEGMLHGVPANRPTKS